MDYILGQPDGRHSGSIHVDTVINMLQLTDLVVMDARMRDLSRDIDRWT